MTVERLTIVLDEKEAAALRNTARADLRKPQAQACYLLRLALGLAESVPTPEKYNRTGEVYETQPSAVAP